MDKPKTHNSDLAHLPTALQPMTEEKRWVNWSWVRRETNGKVRWTKPPFRPSNPQQHADSTDPNTWDTYKRALKRWRDGDADGIGFTLLGSPIGAIDLDDCCRRDAERRKTKTDGWAREVRSSSNGAYCEVTVSGGGLRLIGITARDKVHRRFAIKDARPNAHIELFRKAERFITVSGLQLGNCNKLEPIDDFIDAMVARYDTAPRSQPYPEQRTQWDYDYLIQHGAREGARSEAFHAVIWHLANKGRSIDDIVGELARHPNGIGVKYADRLLHEVTRSYQKWERQNHARSHDVPIIKVEDGKIARMVDEAQAALAQAELPIFVRGGRLVEPITVERDAADGRKTTTTILAPISEEKLCYLLNKQAARFLRYNKRTNEWSETDPPAKLAATVLALKCWQFPEIVGIVGAPTMRPDGSILSALGYDPQTRLWCDADIPLPPIPDKPTREQAATSLRLYKDLLSGFPFVTKTDESVALAAMLTVVLRGAFDLTPMFTIIAHDVGNGKSYLVDLIATLITGRYCPVMTPGQSREEMEKRLGAILLEGGSVLSLDNISFDLESDLLCQILTQPIVKVRILGQSAVPECEWRGTLFGTGNNIRVVGDLVRRSLSCNLDAGVERPELREFKFDPIARVHGERGAYIAAAITIARAYDAAGRPTPGCRPLAGYSAWSQAVRFPLLWLGEHDPVASMETARAADPERAAAYELVMRWGKCIGVKKTVSVRDIINRVNETKERSERLRFPKFRALLIDRAGTNKGDEIDPVRLGKWLQKQHGRVYGTYRIDLFVRKGAVNRYVLTEGEG
jgi:putative DNA primase/helicase